jgi:microcystin-dependent protein
MASPFLSEIRIFSFNFAPRGWAMCNGQTVGIAQNQALFSLLGTTYGGNGTTNFNLPNLVSRTPMHFAPSYPLGSNGGEQAHTLTIAELPMHTHVPIGCSTNATTGDPTAGVWAATATNSNNFTTAAPNNNMSQAAIGNAGGSQPHNNMPPYLVLNFCIAITGAYPTRS